MLKWLLGLAGLAALIVVAGYFVLRRDDIPYETLATRYESAASRYVDLPGGIRMHYRDEGPPEAPTLLLIHGFSRSPAGRLERAGVVRGRPVAKAVRTAVRRVLR